MILFRVDAYPKVGLGHIIRSVAIGSYIKSRTEVPVIFAGYYDAKAIEILESHKIAYINNIAFLSVEEETLLSTIQKRKPNIVFIDKLYPYSCDFINNCKLQAQIIMFHNLCEGAFCVNKFILPSAHHSDEIINSPKWDKLGTDFYYGAKYIPINQEVIGITKHRKANKSNSNKQIVGITTGGSDPKGVMIHILTWLNDNSFQNVEFYALIGKSFMHHKKLNELKSQLPNNICIKPYNYQELIKCNIVISTFGVTTYELMFMGIPVISIGHALNNAKGSEIIEKKYGALIDLGLIDEITNELFINKCEALINSKILQQDLISKSSLLVDDKGIERIYDIIFKN